MTFELHRVIQVRLRARSQDRAHALVAELQRRIGAAGLESAWGDSPGSVYLDVRVPINWTYTHAYEYVLGVCEALRDSP